ncbi:AfsR/SARP family transcriptional regulator [Kitasatospora sp. NBC_01302]|uniref:AfsR/SARP family transcriptional regulator n=1 Tax=Kitasatospora sp. NBC_01302 TaxID=2903575 RepID=UPI002E0EC9D9|nr:winged helix-turn-helix domain-containing protein [Kitasatospora sp. NBC_01302]
MRGDVVPPGRLCCTLLGPLRVSRDSRPLELGPYKQRLLLAALLCRANTVLSVDQLIEALWPDGQPRTARKNLQVYVSALRKIMPDHIDHLPYGYTLVADAEESDLLRFEELTAAGRHAQHQGDRAGAAELLGRAVRLWRDRPLVDLLDSPFAAEESQRLTERFLAAYEDWAELEVETGRAHGLLDQLGELAGHHPFRERLVALHMTALDQVGGRRKALACFEAHRQFIARELGLDPSPYLRRLYREILLGESPASRPASAPTAAAPVGVRIRPAQLPCDLSDFVGRDKVVAELRAALTGAGPCPGVVLVSGPAGSGKTALAVHAGHLVADHFADGQVVCSLSHPDGTPRPWPEVLAELLRSTGLEIDPPAGEAAALALWRSWLAERQFLLVLDGATSEADVRRLLPGRSRSRTLVTTARRFGALECVHRVELDEFSSAEAGELLARVLGGPRVAGHEQSLDRVRELYGLSPAVVRALAAKLTVLGHLSLREYADQLVRLPAALDELRVGEACLHDGYRRFHQGLAPAQRAAFGALGALPAAPFDLARLQAVIDGVDGLSGPAQRVAEELLEAHLVSIADAGDEAEVVAHTVRYRIAPLAHRYAAALHRAATPPAH